MTRIIVTLALLLVAPLCAEAHESRPIFVQISEVDELLYSVYWKVPVTVPRTQLPTPALPEHCVPLIEQTVQQQSGAYLAQQRYRCEKVLTGQRLGMVFPAANPSLSTLFQVKLANGEQFVHILKPSERTWAVPSTPSQFGVAKQYTLLGIAHIWTGIDHLLFVACLMWLARTPRRLLITITGFTLAHSITLILSTLGVLRVPVPPVEAVIALSVVFLAYEIVRDDASSLTFRYPIAVSSAFGLLHGFGFAAVLREIGLPQIALPTALLFFNVGVEIGQLLFVTVMIAAWLMFGVVNAHATRSKALLFRYDKLGAPMTTVAGYLIGCIASYWLIDRMRGFWV